MYFKVVAAKLLGYTGTLLIQVHQEDMYNEGGVGGGLRGIYYFLVWLILVHSGGRGFIVMFLMKCIPLW